jgi:uncharacterized membrane protein
MNFSKLLSLIVCALTMIFAVSRAQATAYNFVTLIAPGLPQSQALDINNRGQVTVGGFDLVSGAGGNFLWQAGVFTPIADMPGAYSTSALGLSDSGVIVGNSIVGVPVYDAGGNQTNFTPSHGLIIQGSSYLTLDRPGATDTYLRGISPDGRFISGYSFDDTSGASGFVYDRVSAAFTSLDSSGIGVSTSNIAQGISANGLIVGSDIIRVPGQPTQRPGYVFDLNTGLRTDVFIPGLPRIAFRDIDANGHVVGWAVDSAGATHGLVGGVGGFSLLDFPGAPYTVLEGINDAGVLAGFYQDVTGASFGFLAIPVPEPGSAGLMVLGLAALVPTLRRRRLP